MIFLIYSCFYVRMERGERTQGSNPRLSANKSGMQHASRFYFCDCDGVQIWDSVFYRFAGHFISPFVMVPTLP
jgi:hypothetical protein